jgi:hypothetical protein
MTNLALKFRILERFRTQADFAQTVGVNDAVVSRVIRGYKSLKPERQRVWAKTLRCPLRIFKTNAKGNN